MNISSLPIRACLATLALIAGATARGNAPPDEPPDNPVLEWNQIFVDTLIATRTANSSSQRLGAIVHTAMFDAHNGIERSNKPILVRNRAPQGASRNAAVIAAAHTVLVALFPARREQLDASYQASLEGLDEARRDWKSRARGLAWGQEVAAAVLAWRAEDGFNVVYSPAFAGGTTVGQWRPVPPATGMSAEALAFTDLFLLDSKHRFRPPPPRGLLSAAFTNDFNAVKALGRNTGSARTDEQTALAPFWEGNASVHWNQAANQIARANRLSMSRTSRLLALLNLAMADTAITIWSAKRFYGEIPTEVTWRPVTAIALAELDGNPDTAPESDWLPLVTTPSHPEYPAGHPALNGAAASVLLGYFRDKQTFTLTTGDASRTYESISQARRDGNDARVWGGMHYPSTVAVSDSVGEKIARHLDRHSMQPRDRRRD